MRLRVHQQFSRPDSRTQAQRNGVPLLQNFEEISSRSQALDGVRGHFCTDRIN
jgi:hypothetical protein